MHRNKSKNQAARCWWCIQMRPRSTSGATMHMAAVNADRTPEPVRSFGTFTTDIYIGWLTGLSSAASIRSSWSRPASIGSPDL